MRFLDDLFSKVLLQEALDTVSVVELQKPVVPSGPPRAGISGAVARDTRVLRLLGPPKLRQAAMAELARLPPSDPARQPLLEILSELIYLSRIQPESAEPLTVTESADMTELRREFEAFKASLRLEGKVEGELEGETKGRAEGKAEALLAVLTARGVTIPDVLRQQILACRDLTQLDRLLVQAATATSPADVLIAAA